MGKWNSHSISIFVFRFRMTLKNRYEFRFSFSHHFEKRIWTSFFVFRLTLKNGYEFLFSFSHHFEKRIWISFLYGLLFEKQIWISFVIWSPRTPPLGWPGNSLFMQRKATEFGPGAKVSGELPRPHDIPPTHCTPFLTRDDKQYDDSREKNTLISEQLSQHLYTLDGKGKWGIFEDFTTWSHKMRDKKNYKSSFTVFWSFCRMTQLLQVSFLSSFKRYNYIIST